MARGQSFDRAPASDVLSSVDDASSTLRVYADGSAILQYKEQHKVSQLTNQNSCINK